MARKPRTLKENQQIAKELTATNNYGLNTEQELFCQYYVSQEFFANGTRSYASAYNIELVRKTDFDTCSSNSSRLLGDVKICQYINELLEVGGLNDEFVDKQMSFLITQNQDFSAKIQAMKMYNDLKKRITKKLEITGKDGNAIEINSTIVNLKSRLLESISDELLDIDSKP